MRRIVFLAVLHIALLFPFGKCHAQFATIDLSNLTQAVLSFLQDGDNIAMNSAQFLENIGVMREQLDFLREMDRRYKEVRADLYKAQEVIRIAGNYEMNIRMFSYYVQRVRSLDSKELEYYHVRSLVNEGFQYLLVSSREVKRAREYLSPRAEMGEDQRRKGLEECDRRICRANVALYNHISGSLGKIDNGRMLAGAVESIDSAFEMKW